MEATVPGGGSCTGRVTARPAGETLELSGDTTAGRYYGVGLEQGGAGYVACGEEGEGRELAGAPAARGLALPTAPGWAIAWSPAFRQTAILAYRPGDEPGTWTVRWALGGRRQLATEVLRPAG